jgi:hypothetical protein
MKRLIILLLLSVFSFGIYAQYAESSYSVISHRQYGTQDSYSQTTQSHYGDVYQTSSRSAHYGAEQSDGYRLSHHNIVDYQDCVSANTFSSTPSMEITTMLSPEPDHNDNSNMAEPAGIRPPQRGVGEGDEKPEEGWEEPFPLGDTPWMLITLLALGYALRQRAIQRKEITD